MFPINFHGMIKTRMMRMGVHVSVSAEVEVSSEQDCYGMERVSLGSYWEMKNDWRKEQHQSYCSVNERRGTASVV